MSNSKLSKFFINIPSKIFLFSFFISLFFSHALFAASFSNGGFSCNTKHDISSTTLVENLVTGCSVSNGDTNTSDLADLIAGTDPLNDMGADADYIINGEPELYMGLNSRLIVDDDLQVSAILGSGANNGEIYFNDAAKKLTIYGGDIDQDGLTLNPETGFSSNAISQSSVTDGPSGTTLNSLTGVTISLNLSNLPQFIEDINNPGKYIPNPNNSSGFLPDPINTGDFIIDVNNPVANPTPENPTIYVPDVNNPGDFILDSVNPPAVVDTLTGWKHTGYKGDVGKSDSYLLSIFFDADATLEFRGDAYIKSINNDGTNIGNLIFNNSSYDTSATYNANLADKNIQKIFTDIGISPPRLNSITINSNVQFTGNGIYAKTLYMSGSASSTGLLNFQETHITGYSAIGSNSSMNLGNMFIESARSLSTLSDTTVVDLDLAGSFATLSIGSEFTISGNVTGTGTNIIQGSSDSSADIIFASNSDQSVAPEVRIGAFNSEISTIFINNIAQNQVNFNGNVFADNLSFGGSHKSILSIAAGKSLNISDNILEVTSHGSFITGAGDLVINGINTDQVVSIQLGDSTSSRLNELSIESTGSGTVTFNKDAFVDTFDLNAAKTIIVNSLFDVSSAFNISDDLTIQGIGTLKLGPVNIGDALDINTSNKKLILEVDTTFDNLNFNQIGSSLLISEGNTLNITGDVVVAIGADGKIDGPGDDKGSVIFSGVTPQIINVKIGNAINTRINSVSSDNVNLVTFNDDVYATNFASVGEVIFNGNLHADNFSSDGVVTVSSGDVSSTSFVIKEDSALNGNVNIFEDLEVLIDKTLTFGNVASISIEVSDDILGLGIISSDLATAKITFNGSGDADGEQRILAQIGADNINRFNEIQINNSALIVDDNGFSFNSLDSSYLYSSQLILFTNNAYLNDVTITNGIFGIVGNGNVVDINGDLDLSSKTLYILVSSGSVNPFGNINLNGNELTVDANTKIDVDFSVFTGDLALGGTERYTIISGGVAAIGTYNNINTSDNSDLYNVIFSIDNSDLIVDVYRSDIASPVNISFDTIVSVDINYSDVTFFNGSTLTINDGKTLNITGDVVLGDASSSKIIGAAHNQGRVTFSGDSSDPDVTPDSAQTISVQIGEGPLEKIASIASTNATLVTFLENVHVVDFAATGDVTFDKDLYVDAFYSSGVVTSSGDIYSLVSFAISDNSILNGAVNQFVDFEVASGKTAFFGNATSVDIDISGDISGSGIVTSSLASAQLTLSGASKQDVTFQIGVDSGNRFNEVIINKTATEFNQRFDAADPFVYLNSNRLAMFLEDVYLNTITITNGVFGIAGNGKVIDIANNLDLSNQEFYILVGNDLSSFGTISVGGQLIVNENTEINIDYSSFTGVLDVDSIGVDYTVIAAGSVVGGAAFNGIANVIDNSVLYGTSAEIVGNNLVITVLGLVGSGGASSINFSNNQVIESDVSYGEVTIADGKSVIIDQGVVLDISGNVTAGTESVIRGSNHQNGTVIFSGDGNQAIVSKLGVDADDRLSSVASANSTGVVTFHNNVYTASFESLGDVVFLGDIYADSFTSSGLVTSSGSVISSSNFNVNENFDLNGAINQFNDISIANGKILNFGNSNSVSIEVSGDISGSISSLEQLTSTSPDSTLTLLGNSKQTVSAKIGSSANRFGKMVINNTGSSDSSLRFDGDSSYLHSSSLAMFEHDLFLYSLDIQSGSLGISGNSTEININGNLDLSGKNLYILVGSDSDKPFGDIDLNGNLLTIDNSTSVDIDFSTFTGSLAASGSVDYSIITAGTSSGSYDNANTHDNSALYDSIISIDGNNNLIVTISRSDLFSENSLNKERFNLFNGLSSSTLSAALYTLDITSKRFKEEVKTLTPSKNGGNSNVVSDISNATNNVISSYVRNSKVAISGFSSGNAQKNESGIWGQTFAGTSKQDDIGDTDGYTANFGGFVFGADKTLTGYGLDNMIGLAFSYGRANISDDSLAKSNDSVNSYKLTLYNNNSAPDKMGFYTDSMLNLSFNQYKLRRKMVLNGLESSVESDFNGMSYGARVGFGYNSAFNNYLLFIPSLSINYLRSSQDDYTQVENGNQWAKVSSDDVDRISSELGFALMGRVDYSDISYIPKLKMAWIHQFKTNGQESNIEYINNAGSVGNVNNSVDIQSNLLQLGFGVETISKGGHGLSLEYNLRAADGFLGHSGSLKYRFSF